MLIDTALDLGLDAGGRDPDLYSNTLKHYHKQLWSKELPSGKLFKLSDSITGNYLTFKNGLDSIELGSDSIANSYAASSSAQILKIVAEIEQYSWCVHYFSIHKNRWKNDNQRRKRI